MSDTRAGLFYPVSDLSRLPISASHVKLLVTSGESTCVSGQSASSAKAQKASLRVFAAEQGTTDCSRTEEVMAGHLSKQRSVEWTFGGQVALTIPLGAVEPV